MHSAGRVLLALVAVSLPASSGSLAWRPSPQADTTPPIVVLLDRYERSDFTAAALAERTPADRPNLVAALERHGDAWIQQDPRRASHRRLVAAAFALEAGYSLLHTPNRILSRRLVAWACRRMREAPPDAAARRWHLASLALIQGAEDWDLLTGGDGNGELRDGHLAHATAAFPDEPRFALAGAVAAENRSRTAGGSAPLRGLGRGGPGAGGSIARDLTSVADRYAALVTIGPLQAEARLRLGLSLLRLGNRGAAVAHFQAAEGLTADPHLLHLCRLLTGVILESDGRTADAVQQYRRALDAVPRAQSATALLAAASFAGRRHDEAAEVVEALFTASKPPDPWRLYWTGDARLWPEHLSQLRLALR